MTLVFASSELNTEHKNGIYSIVQRFTNNIFIKYIQYVLGTVLKSYQIGSISMPNWKMRKLILS